MGYENTVFDCNVITLLKHHAEQGNLTLVENGAEHSIRCKESILPLIDMDGGDHPNGHANKKMRQLVLATCGSFSITLDDGQQKRTVFLNGFYGRITTKPEAHLPQIIDCPKKLASTAVVLFKGEY